MNRPFKWFDHLTINAYWLGLNVNSGTITPVLLPFLVVMFMPPDQKNTHLATVRVIGLAVAMLVQPLAGMLSDRSTSKNGRRRPFIFWGALLSVVFLGIVGASVWFNPSSADPFFKNMFGITTAFAVLLLGTVLLQVSSNIGHGALQGLIPDVAPENQRGRASGVKAVLELLPVFLVLFIGPLVDKGHIWGVVAILMFSLISTMLVTVLLTHETPQMEKSQKSIQEPVIRLVALTAIFVGVTRLAVWLVNASGSLALAREASTLTTILVVGFAGLVGMAGSVFIGVYFGAWVGIGRDAPQQKTFIWWVVNRLLFLAAVGSIQGFAQYYLRDVLKIPNAATMTTVLLAVVALFLMPSAIFGGYLADRFGRKRLVVLSGLIAAAGTLLLLFATSMPLVIVSGCIIGLGTGTFMATNWALGTDLVPAADAGRYLGISNLAGAGAGIVGTGIGGPMADYFNAIQPGMGYLVIFALYGILFLIASLVMGLLKVPDFHENVA